MFESIVDINNISFLIIFLGGFLSFFSPCIIPLIPIYMAYLAGNTTKTNETDGSISYQRKKVLLHTTFFVIGISFAFILLGLSFTTLGSFFNKNQMLFTKIGGILIVILGLFQLGIFEIPFLQHERRIGFHFGDRPMSPFLAFLMGFTFSFAWTPCVGPALSTVLILASGAKTSNLGLFLVILYTLGFVIPFLLLGIFTTELLNFFKKSQKLLKYTVKIGGAMLIIIGVMTFTGWMNGISSYLNAFTPPINTRFENDLKPGNVSPKDESENTVDNNNGDRKNTSKERKKIEAPDFTLFDQYGNTHTLSDYKGKVVFVNFWATWCPPCRKEMPDIESLYQEYNFNKDDVVILGIANPKTKEYPNNIDIKKDDIITFLEDHELTFPTLFDETGETFYMYSISGYPTTFFIDQEGYIFGYYPAMLDKQMMKSLIKQTLEVTH